jgi:hypothetical protein
MRVMVIGLALALGGCWGLVESDGAPGVGGDDGGSTEALGADGGDVRCFDALGNEMNCSNAAALCQSAGTCEVECAELRRCYIDSGPTECREYELGVINCWLGHQK